MSYIKNIYWSILIFVKLLINTYRNASFFSAFPSIKVEMPSKIMVDNFNAIKADGCVHIGPYSELIVLQKSSFSKIAGSLTLGSRVVIGARANIRAAGGAINIGDNVLVAQNVSIIAANHSVRLDLPYRDSSWDNTRTGVSIEQNVWIGANAIILPGVTIGANSILAAGSVVTRSVPANEIWGGVPANRIRSIQS
jgi:acetyltransferase-like isoleucine patch superfamily enzyme